MTSFRLNTYPTFWEKKEHFIYIFLPKKLSKAKVQKEVFSKRSNWTGVKSGQAYAQQPSQTDCNIWLTHPTHAVQKLTEDLSEGKSKPSPTFFS